jgi:hypothetical protein
MSQIYYKCLGNNRSIIGLKGISLYYTLNEWVYPVIPNSKLFVFDTLKSAKECYLGNQIFECEIFGVPESPSYIADIYEVKDFWKRINKEQLPDFNNMDILPPVGTLLVDAVKITKLISEVKYE